VSWSLEAVEASGVIGASEALDTPYCGFDSIGRGHEVAGSAGKVVVVVRGHLGCDPDQIGPRKMGMAYKICHFCPGSSRVHTQRR